VAKSFPRRGRTSPAGGKLPPPDGGFLEEEKAFAGGGRLTERIQELVEEVEREAAAERERTGREPLGPEAILKQQPTSQPGVPLPAG
jgi:hypothetical protein